MIIQRISKGIKDQDWFVVTIEVMIVVLGIFIGLQVDDWRQEREIKNEETLMIFSLREDVLDLIKLTENAHGNLKRDNDNIASTIYFLQNYTDQGEMTDNQCTAVWQSHIIGVYLLRSLSSLETIIVSGRLNVISNPFLRNRLVALRSESERHQKFHNYISATAANLIDNFVHELPSRLTQINDKTSWDKNLSVSCNIPLIVENPIFMNRLRTNLGRRTGLSGSISSLLKSLHLIEEELLMETEKN